MNECNFYPYQQVLVRNTETQMWRPTFFGFMTKNGGFYCTDGITYKYCIQYAGNEELCGTVGKKRQRAEYGKKYYCVSMLGEVTQSKEIGDSCDDSLFHAGNYFLNEEDAEKVANGFKELLIKNLQSDL